MQDVEDLMEERAGLHYKLVSSAWMETWRNYIEELHQVSSRQGAWSRRRRSSSSMVCLRSSLSRVPLPLLPACPALSCLPPPQPKPEPLSSEDLFCTHQRVLLPKYIIDLTRRTPATLPKVRSHLPPQGCLLPAAITRCR